MLGSVVMGCKDRKGATFKYRGLDSQPIFFQSLRWEGRNSGMVVVCHFMSRKKIKRKQLTFEPALKVQMCRHVVGRG